MLPRAKASTNAYSPEATAAVLINVMTGSLYAVAHRDSIYLSLLSPFFDFYQGILVNCARFIAMLDEARGARMRW